jgi:hypothetical protein
MITVTRTFEFATQPQASASAPATYTMGLQPVMGEGYESQQTGLSQPKATFNGVPLGATLRLYVKTHAGGVVVAEHTVDVSISALPSDPLIYVPTGSPTVS